MKIFYKSIITMVLALLISAGSSHIGVTEVFAAAESQPTITMGNNAPMPRDEFMQWKDQNGIRHFSLDERIMPAGTFFNSYNGKAFRFGELNDGILPVYLILEAALNDSNPSVNAAPATELTAAETPSQQSSSIASPVLFYDLTPILFSDEELAAMIENIPNEGPLETRSAITLPNKKLTKSELESWIAEYNEMGGASAFELGVIREINRVRVQHNLQPLALNPALMTSSRLKAQEFGDLQYYRHRSPVHGSIAEAAKMFGYDGMIGEATTRIGSNGEPSLFTTPERIVEGMLASTSGHRDLLLSPNLYSVGFGAFFSPNSKGTNGNLTHTFYFVTQFGFID